jgi:hypothetical protein
MNKDPEKNDLRLDRLLDETLANLHEQKAPESMLANIMSRVAVEEEKQRLSWFARLQWPVVAVCACFVFFATYFSDEAVTAFLNFVNAGQFAGGIDKLNFGLEIAGTLASAFRKVFELVPSALWYSLVALMVTVSTFSCAGLGTLLFRLTRSGTPMSPKQNPLS